MSAAENKDLARRMLEQMTQDWCNPEGSRHDM